MEKEIIKEEEKEVTKEEEKEVTNTPVMTSDTKSNIAIILSIVAIGIALYGGGLSTNKAPEGPEEFIKMTAKDAGMSGRSYDKCIEDPAIQALVQEDINETQAIVAVAGLQGIGTPFNLVITDSQIIPVNGAYPYEVFDLLVKEITKNGTVSKEILDQASLAEFSPEVRDQFRPFSPEYDHYRGSEQPAIAIVEYSDMECPFCARVHPTLEKIVSNNSNVAWAYRHLPLDFHPQAMPAAIASECVAREEGNEAFGKFIDTIFENQDKLSK